jgi:hypothetical protein
MANGFSYESFAGKIHTTFQTLYNWEKLQPAFLEAKNHGTARCRLWWEEQAFRGTWNNPNGKNLNNAIWIFNMKNRFKWSDNMVQTTTVKVEDRNTLIAEAKALLSNGVDGSKSKKSSSTKG